MSIFAGKPPEPTTDQINPPIDIRPGNPDAQSTENKPPTFNEAELNQMFGAPRI